MAAQVLPRPGPEALRGVWLLERPVSRLAHKLLGLTSSQAPGETCLWAWKELEKASPSLLRWTLSCSAGRPEAALGSNEAGHLESRRNSAWPILR